MQLDAGLEWQVHVVRQAHVVLALTDQRGHAATTEMAMADALRLAEVLTSEMHGSCPDTWLVERLAGTEQLWLTLSRFSRGCVHISRIELTSTQASALAQSLTEVTADCTTVAVRHPRRTGLLRPLRVLLRWGVLHTRTRRAPHQHTQPSRQPWTQSLHRSMLVLYRALAAAERPTMVRTG